MCVNSGGRGGGGGGGGALMCNQTCVSFISKTQCGQKAPIKTTSESVWCAQPSRWSFQSCGLLWNEAWEGLSWYDVWTQKTEDIPPSCLQWAVMGTGVVGPHIFPRDSFSFNLFRREQTKPSSHDPAENMDLKCRRRERESEKQTHEYWHDRNSLQFWNSDLCFVFFLKCGFFFPRLICWAAGVKKFVDS